MELVLMVGVGCSAIDMISILRSSDKRLVLKAEVEGERVQVGRKGRLKIFMLFF
jgi:hypothetical protein